MNEIRPDSVNPDRIIMSLSNHTITKCGFCEYTELLFCWKTPLLIATGLSVSFYGMLSLSSQKKEKLKAYPAFPQGTKQ